VLTKQELSEKLPKRVITIDTTNCLILYYDWYGVTFTNTEEDKQTVEDYLVEIVQDKIGKPVRVSKWSIGNNGHFADEYELIYI